MSEVLIDDGCGPLPGLVREQAPFYVTRALEAGSPVLEVGCGSGQMLGEMSKAGLDAWGVDSSSTRLERASLHLSAFPPDQRGRIHLLEADMRSFRVDVQFALIYAPFHAFMSLLTVEDQLEALAAFRRHLRRGGGLLVNLYRPDLKNLADLNAGEPQRLLRKSQGDHQDPETDGRVLVSEAAGHDPILQLIYQERIFDTLDEQGRIIRRSYLQLTRRYTHRWEVEHLLYRAGFHVERIWGDFEGADYDGQREMIFMARPGPVR